MYIKFREINKAEIPLIKKIIESNIRTDFPEYSQRIKEYILKHELDLEEKLSISIFNVWGAFKEDKPVGYLIGFGPVGGVVEIHWLGVLKALQGKGIATKFVEFFLDWAKNNGAHAIHLYSSKENLAFYEKLDFEKVGLIRKSFWGSDDYFMSKNIQEPREDNFFKKSF